jgi:hypothetical protein
MCTTLKPAGLVLVGFAFLFICILCQLGAGAAWSTSPSYPDSLSGIEKYHSNFINNQYKPTTEGELSLPDCTVYFPWASRQVLGLRLNSPDIISSSRPVKESVTMEGSHPSEQVQDLKAMNSAKQRDIAYGETQTNNNDPENLVNSMSVMVDGEQNKNEQTLDHLDNNDPERIVDSSLNSAMNNGNQKSNPGNYLNVDVSGISVSAINTVEGGSAVATSNIIIKPVQLIVNCPEVAEKLA